MALPRRVSCLLLCAALTACAPDDARPSEADRPDRAVREGATVSASPTPGTGPALPTELARALDGEPREASSAQQVSDQIVAAEQAITDPGTPPDVLAAAGHLQQLAYRELGTRPGWDRHVRAALPAGLRRTVADNVAARRAFRTMHPTSPRDLADELPAWRIVRPPSAEVLLKSYREAERRFGVDWEYLAAINLVETVFGRIRGTSVAGAQGPMQFIPTTWDIYGAGGDITDPHDAVLAAGRMLRANGFADDRSGALYRYNNSAAYVRGVTLHARVMQRDPRAFLGYYHWQVYYLTTRGSVLLPEGYDASRPIPVDRWLRRSR